MPIFSSSIPLLPFVLLLLGGIYVLLIGYGWSFRRASSGRIFGLLMLTIAIWTLGYAFELLAESFAVKLFWAKVEYVGIVFLPLFWLTFAVEYTGRGGWREQRWWRLLFVLPSITLGLVWTNEIHHLIWTQIDLIELSGLRLLDSSYGPMFWVHTAYSYGLLGIGNAMLVFNALHAPRLYRSQATAILIAALFPLLGNLTYLFNWIPGLAGLDLTVFFFLPSAGALAWAIARSQLLEIMPLAQSAILDSLNDGILSVDDQYRVLFMNRRMEEICGMSVDQATGKPIQMVCLDAEKLFQQDVSSAILYTKQVNDQYRTFEVYRTRMEVARTNTARLPFPELMIVHDVTERLQAEQALRRRDAILHAVSLAAEQFLATDWEQSVSHVLEQLGQAAEVSRVYIFERHVSETGAPLVSQRYEWATPGITPQIDNPELQNLPYLEVGFEEWERAFLNHQPVVCKVRELPEQPRSLLAAQDIRSLVVMPIFSDSELWGFIGFDDCLQEREWSEAELGALSAAAGIFGAAIQRRKTELRLRERQQVQDLLQVILRLALEQPNTEAMAQVVVDGLGRLLGADRCFLTRWDERSRRVVPFVAYGMPTESYRSVYLDPEEKTFTVSVLEAGHPLIAEDVMNSPYISPRIAALFQVRSVLAVPMIAGQKRLGAVLIGFSQAHTFTPQEIQIAEQATELLTLALARNIAMEEAQRRVEEAETLRKAVATVAETLDLQETITRILEQLAFVLPHDSASIQLLRDGELEIIGGDGWEDPSQVIGLRFPVPGDNPNTVVIQTGRPYLVQEAEKVYSGFRHPPHNHIRCWLGVPLIVHSRMIGLLAVDGRHPFQFSEADIELVSAFADQVAMAIENARLFDAVQRMAIIDELTGLYNRRHFMKLAHIEFERARRYKRQLSVMMFDIDHFKKVNDTYGHMFGDQVLAAIGALCRQRMRDIDPIGRYGGDEFVAMVLEADLKQAREVGERLRTQVEQLIFDHPAGEVRVTISVGVAEQDHNTSDLDALIAQADQALYMAKNQGRNRVVAL